MTETIWAKCTACGKIQLVPTDDSSEDGILDTYPCTKCDNRGNFIDTMPTANEITAMTTSKGINFAVEPVGARANKGCTFKTFCEQLLSTYNATPDEWEHYKLLCLDDIAPPQSSCYLVPPEDVEKIENARKLLWQVISHYVDNKKPLDHTVFADLLEVTRPMWEITHTRYESTSRE